MDLELDLSSENMASFLELEQEIKEIPLYPEPMVRPSVIVKLLEMETEFKYLKKLMVEAGLGKYTLAVNY